MITEFVTWWCHLLGITSEAAIQVAVGIAGAGLLFFAAMFALGIVVALFTVIKEAG